MKFAGLTQEQVKESRVHGRTNALTELPPESFWLKLAKGFGNPLILILLVALGIQLGLFFCGRAGWYEPFGIFVAILIANGVAAVFESQQEGKATALRREANAKEKCKVVRASVLTEVPLEEVVVGDIVFLQAGDRVPADGVLVDGELAVDQAALNGEAEETPKRALRAEEEFSSGDLLNPYCLFRGSVVCSGEAFEEVKVVGDGTVFGQAALTAQVKPRATPLQVKLSKLASHISLFGYVGAAVIVSTILLVTLLRGENPGNLADWVRLLVDAVTVAVTIIVCAVPEGLPMLSSILQALQSLKMVKDNVLVRKINGLETAGSLSILFCDKTGTITAGQLSVVELATGDLASYTSLAGISLAVREEVVCGIGLNNRAVPCAGAVIGGNGTDRALLQFLLANGLEGQFSRENVTRFEAFDSNKKTSSIEVRRGEELLTYVKGAPEKILERCDKYLDCNGSEVSLDDRARIVEYLNAQSARSMRLLAVARVTPAQEGDWTLVCLVSIRDNVRREVKTAVQDIQNAGIQVVMVTGDRKETAVAIAREAGLLTTPNDLVLTSFELAKMSDDAVKELLPRLRVVARALPLDKSRLVRLAQELNLVVGMTGDGVNDAPALRKADVGFAMGSGTEVAKEAGDITILDDNLSSIEKAILYGRTMFKSIRKFLIFQLTVNVASVLICAIGPMFGMNVVLTVIQLLLINLAMDTLAAIAFGSEPPLQEYLREKPVPRSESIVTREMLSEAILGAGVISAVCLGILLLPGMQRFIAATNQDGLLNPVYLHSALFATFMMAITFNGLNARTTHLNPFEGLGRNKTFLAVMGFILALQFVFVTFGGETLSVTPLSTTTWLRCLLLACLVVPLDLLRRCLKGNLKHLIEKKGNACIPF